MDAQVQEVKEVATALGLRSKAALAEICGVSANTPYEWGARIPNKHRPTILNYARRQGLTLPRSFLIASGMAEVDTSVASEGNGKDVA